MSHGVIALLLVVLFDYQARLQNESSDRYMSATKLARLHYSIERTGGAVALGVCHPIDPHRTTHHHQRVSNHGRAQGE